MHQKSDGQTECDLKNEPLCRGSLWAFQLGLLLGFVEYTSAGSPCMRGQRAFLFQAVSGTVLRCLARMCFQVGQNTQLRRELQALWEDRLPHSFLASDRQQRSAEEPCRKRGCRWGKQEKAAPFPVHIFFLALFRGRDVNVSEWEKFIHSTFVEFNSDLNSAKLSTCPIHFFAPATAYF